MSPSRKVVVGAVGLVLLGGGSLLALEAFWRPVMPVVTVDLLADDDQAGTGVMVLYGSRGTDPFREGNLAPDQRISGCDPRDGVCISYGGRKAFRLEGRRTQSLAFRRMRDGENTLIGGVVWTGPAYPERLRITCDLRVKDVRAACTMAESAV